MKMASLKSLLIIFGISIVMVTGNPGESFAVQAKGDNEIQLSGGFFHSQGTDVGTLTLDVSYGYYLTNVWEVGIAQTLNYNFIDDGDDTWSASTIPFINYHILGLSQNNTFQPFLGAFLGAIYTDDKTTGTAGPAIGFKAFLNEKTFLVTRYRYEWFFEELEVGNVTDTSHGNHVVTVGMGFLW